MELNTKEQERFTKFFFVKHRKELHKIRLDDILYIQSDQNYCFIHLKNKKFVVKISLTSLLNKLPKNKFVRTHQSYAVAIEWIDKLNIGERTIVIEGISLPLSRNYRKDLLNEIHVI